MNARKCLFAAVAATIAAAGLASAAPASACEAHHPAAIGAERSALDIKSQPSDLRKSPGERGPQTFRVDLETVEAAARLGDDAGHNHWALPKKRP